MSCERKGSSALTLTGIITIAIKFETGTCNGDRAACGEESEQKTVIGFAASIRQPTLRELIDLSFASSSIKRDCSMFHGHWRISMLVFLADLGGKLPKKLRGPLPVLHVIFDLCSSLRLALLCLFL